MYSCCVSTAATNEASVRNIMPTPRAAPRNIDEYIALVFAGRPLQAILERIRLTIRETAPGAQEVISYKIPAFTQEGILVYFAAFKKHIGAVCPLDKGRRKAGESHCSLCRRKGQPAVSAR